MPTGEQSKKPEQTNKHGEKKKEKEEKKEKNRKAKLNRIINKDLYVLKSYYCKNRTIRKTKQKMLLNKEKKKLLEPHTHKYIYIKGIKSVIFLKSSQQHRVNSHHKINNHSNREGGK